MLVPIAEAVEVVVLVAVQSRPEEPSKIPALSALESLQAPQRVCLKDDDPTNISSISVTLDTSH